MTSDGIVHVIVVEVVPETGSVAHARSLGVKTSSLLKSIHAQRCAVLVTPANETLMEYGKPTSAALSVGQVATPSSVVGMTAPAATASPFVVA